MKPRNIGFCIWLGAIIVAAGDPPDIQKIVVPDVAEPDLSDSEVDDSSAISQKCRKAVSAKIVKAFSQADSVLIASLEPNSPFLMKQVRPEMVAFLRKDLLDGRACYGSLTLDLKSVPKFREAIVSSIEEFGAPRLGFCWSPRHAIIIRKTKEPELVVEICYQCGGMRLKDGEETLTFYPPRSIRKDMDDLFDVHKIPKSTPIKKRAEKGGGRQPSIALDSRSEDDEKPKPESEDNDLESPASESGSPTDLMTNEESASFPVTHH